MGIKESFMDCCPVYFVQGCRTLDAFGRNAHGPSIDVGAGLIL